MENPHLSPYEQQRREAKSILNRIHYRQYQQIKRQRSEGFQIAEDIKDELRKSFRRAQDETIHRNFKKRMSEQNLQYQKIQKKQKRRMSAPEETRLFPFQNLENTKNQITEKLANNNYEVQTIDKCSSQLVKRKLSKLKEEMVQFIGKVGDNYCHASRVETQLQEYLYKYKETKSFLPMLQFLQQQTLQNNKSKELSRTQNLVTQMLLLALARKNNNKILSSLDILIQIDAFFIKENHQLDHIKSVWFQFIAKLYLQIANEDKKPISNAQKNHYQPDSHRSSIGRRRQQTVMVRSLVSRRQFFNRVSIELDKLKLIQQTSYQRQLKDEANVIEENQDSGKIVISRANKYLVLSYPEPKDLFPSIDEINNYGIIIINRDKKSNLFPQNFPSALEDILLPSQYLSNICRVNSILIPERRCFNFNTALNYNFEPIFGIFLLFCFIIISILVLTRQLGANYAVDLVIFFGIILIALLSLRLQMTVKSRMGVSSDIYLSVSKILQEWNDQYQKDTIKFILGQHVELILISFPKATSPDQFGSQDRSQSNLRSNEHLTSFFQKNNNPIPVIYDEIIENSHDESSLSSRQQQPFQKQAEIEQQARQIQEQMSNHRQPSNNKVIFIDTQVVGVIGCETPLVISETNEFE